MLYNITKQLIKLLPDIDNELVCKVGFIHCILEYRTITLGVPRRSGKTQTVIKLAREYSSLVVTRSSMAYRNEDRNLYVINEIHNLDALRGKHMGNLKYQCVIIDEDTSINLPELITTLRILNLVSADFFIIKLGTPVK